MIVLSATLQNMEVESCNNSSAKDAPVENLRSQNAHSGVEKNGNISHSHDAALDANKQGI